MSLLLPLTLLAGCQELEPPEDSAVQGSPTELVLREVSKVQSSSAQAMADESLKRDLARGVAQDNARFKYLLHLPKITAWAKTYVDLVRADCKDTQETLCVKYYFPDDPEVGSLPGAKETEYIHDKKDGSTLSSKWEYSVAMPIEHQTCTVAWPLVITPETTAQSLTIHCLGAEVYTRTREFQNQDYLFFDVESITDEESYRRTPLERELFDYIFEPMEEGAPTEEDTAVNE
jgi:hypothetical protein